MGWWHFQVSVTEIRADGNGGVVTETTTAVVQGVGLLDGTLYIIRQPGHRDLKFNEKKDELKVNVRLSQGGGGWGWRQPHPTTYQASAIDQIVTQLCDGDDHYKGGSESGSDRGSDGGDDDGVGVMASQLYWRRW